MKTKFIVALTAFTICICTNMQAQQVDKAKKAHIFPSEKMIKDLKLNEKQVTEIKKATADFKAEVKALKQKASLLKKENKETFKKLKEQHKTAIKKCLSTEQYIKYLEMRTERLEMSATKNKTKGNKCDKIRKGSRKNKVEAKTNEE